MANGELGGIRQGNKKKETLQWVSISVSISMLNLYLVNNNIFKNLFTLYSKQTDRM